MRRWAKRFCGVSLTVLALGAASAEAAQWGGCVAYVRQQTGISIFADAWGWWDGAAGRFERGHTPVPGSILVFRRSSTMRLGHVSMVSAVLDSRTILVDHHWGRAGIIRGHRVVDTSPNNDWSSVRVWHDPSDTPGIYNYPTYGFVYTGGAPAETTTIASAAPMTRPVHLGRQVWNQRGALAENPSAGDSDNDAHLALGPAPITVAMSAPVGIHAPTAPAVTRITAAQAPRPRHLPAARVQAAAGPQAQPAQVAAVTPTAPRPGHSPMRVTMASAGHAQPTPATTIALQVPLPNHHPAARAGVATHVAATGLRQVAVRPVPAPGRHPARAIAAMPQLADTAAGSAAAAPAPVVPVSAIEP